MKRDRFAVIGLGHFGAYALRVLYESGKDVIAVDSDPEKVRDSAEWAREAVTADATDADALVSLGIGEVDVAIVSLGERLDVITLAALHLKEIGVPYIAVKSLSAEHGRILKAIGVHEVVHPERDAATRLAFRLVRQDVIDYLPLRSGYSIIEIQAPPEFVGKSLRELALRNRLQVQLIGIQRGTGPNMELKIVPRAEDVIEASDVMLLLGADKDLDRVREIAGGELPRPSGGR
jgi:trk system potassium uptake protein TrkA